MLTPIIIFDAEGAILSKKHFNDEVGDSQMSHHIGAGLFTFPLQTTEFTKPTRHDSAVHIMNAQVPEFQA